MDQLFSLLFIHFFLIFVRFQCIKNFLNEQKKHRGLTLNHSDKRSQKLNESIFGQFH